MKILLTNNHLGGFGGTESWVYTMVEYLSQHHDVTVFTLNTGKYSEFITRKTGVEVVNELKEGDSYDLMLINHNTCLGHIFYKKVKGKKVYTMHGKVGLCIPIHGADFYIAISEEINDVLKGIIHMDENSTIGKRIVINNPINIKREHPISEINDKINNVLYIGESDRMIKKIGSVASKIGADFKYFNKRDEYSYFPEREINNADIVFTVGRGALESMACGRNVFIIDYRTYNEKEFGDGLITKDNFKSFGYNNFSGRTMKRQYTEEEIISELYGYSKENGEDLRNLIVENHNVENICNQYLSL